MTSGARAVGIALVVLVALVLFLVSGALGAPWGLIPAALGWWLLIRVIRTQRRAVRHIHDDGTVRWTW